MADLGKMSKKQLEAYARKEFDVELDRRHNKKQLLEKVQRLVADSQVEVVTPPPAPKPKAASSGSSIRNKIKDLSGTRRDAAVIWEQIKDGSQSDEEIRSIVNSKNFFVLLGELA